MYHYQTGAFDTKSFCHYQQNHFLEANHSFKTTELVNSSCFSHKPTELTHSFLFCFCVCFCLYGPFNCISFYKFPRQLSAFSLYSSGLISALLVFSTIYLFMEISFSPSPAGSSSRGGDVTVYVLDINQPTLPTPS